MSAISSPQTIIGGVVIVHPEIQVSPASGPGGSTAIVSGSNFPNNQMVSLVINDTKNKSFAIGQATPDGTGAFTVQITIPNEAYPGSAIIYAQQNGITVSSTTFVIPFPTITLNPTSGVDGARVTISGSGFAINQPVKIFIGKNLKTNLISLGSITTDGTGALATQITIPANLSIGNYVISARENVNHQVYAAAIFTVIHAATTTSLSSSANPSTFGKSVTFTATVSAVAPSTGTPTGYVKFIIDGKAQPAVALSGGKATFSTMSLSRGSHTISAKYSGNNNFMPSVASLTQTVQ